MQNKSTIKQLFILSCPTTSHRVAKTIKYWDELNIFEKCHDHLSMIEDDEIMSQISEKYKYRPDFWSKDMNYIKDILLHNIALSKAISDSNQTLNNRIIYLNMLFSSEIHHLFPERSLRSSEHSIVCRHYYILKKYLSSGIEHPLCIIEDDTLPGPEVDKLNIMMESMGRGGENIYIDIADQYVPNRHLLSQAKRWFRTTYGITRTASAYCLSRNAVLELEKNFFPYSLPYDLHLQTLLKKYSIRGLTTNFSITLHGSKLSDADSFS